MSVRPEKNARSSADAVVSTHAIIINRIIMKFFISIYIELLIKIFAEVDATDALHTTLKPEVRTGYILIKPSDR